jgi:polyisoprenoid-binding protein YceI
MMIRKCAAAVATLTMTILVGCAVGADAHSASDSSTAAASTSANAPANAEPLSPGATRFTVASSGNAARFRVREQLMGHDLPNDAVGETQQVSGAITVDSKGALVAGQSKFVVQVTSLRSDSDRRDGYIQHRLLGTDKYPTVQLIPTALRGLPATSASAGTSSPVTFELVGDLTVRGVTHPTIWKVSAKQVDGRVTGSASTRFTFADFAIDPPRVPVVLSVADTIGLEYDFTLTRDAATP